MKDRGYQKSAMIIFIGLAIAVIGLLGWMFFSFTSVSGSIVFYGLALIFFTLIPIGAIIAGIGVIYGATKNKRMRKEEPRRITDVFVISKFMLYKGDQIEDPLAFERHELSYFVRLQFPGQRPDEFETNPDVFETTPEGVRGVAIVQGDWLASFEHTKAAPEDVPEDPFLTGKIK